MLRKYFFLILLLNFPVRAQLDLYTGYQGIYDDNIYNNYQAVSDLVNIFSLGTAYNFESEVNNIQLFYEGNLNAFRTNTSKSFNSHKIGLVETHLFSDDENPLNVGANYSIRNNKDDYVLFDFTQLSAYLNYRHSLSETDFILPGYIFNINNYKNFTIFSNYEHKVFLAFNTNFETSTSLNIRAEGSFKFYNEVYDYPGYLNESSLLKLSINVGQSLGEKTGMNVYGSYQEDISEGSRYIVNDSLIFYEEEIFNDIYSFSGLEAGIGFRHYFTDNIQFHVEAKYLKRMYSSLMAADVYGAEQNFLREDDVIAAGAGIEFNLSSLINGITVSTYFNYFKNSSNDLFYKYNNQIFSVSLDYGF